VSSEFIEGREEGKGGQKKKVSAEKEGEENATNPLP